MGFYVEEELIFLFFLTIFNREETAVFIKYIAKIVALKIIWILQKRVDLIIVLYYNIVPDKINYHNVYFTK